MKSFRNHRLGRRLQGEGIRRCLAVKRFPWGTIVRARSLCSGSERWAGIRARTNFSDELRHWTRLHQRRSDRIAQEVVYDRLLTESDLGLRGVNIHVHLGI